MSEKLLQVLSRPFSAAAASRPPIYDRVWDVGSRVWGFLSAIPQTRSVAFRSLSARVICREGSACTGWRMGEWVRECGEARCEIKRAPARQR